MRKTRGNLLCRVLGRSGAEVVALESAAGVLDEVSGFHPDVLVVDIGFLDQDGYQLIE